MEGDEEVGTGTKLAREGARTMNLSEVLSGIAATRQPSAGAAGARVSGVTCDSRMVAPGNLFFALPGAKADGNQFVSAAIAAGAIAVASATARPSNVATHIEWITLEAGTERKALALAAANFYGHPADALKLVGVTGTNGKTTITFIVDSILHAAGFTTGRIGTTGYQTPKGSRKAKNTTPESVDLQEMFAEIRDAGGTHAVMEVSSHALAMDRVWGCHFAAAIFTNLTRDHLNFHKTFDEYFAAKRVLFEGTGGGAPDFAIVNADDAYGPRLEGLAAETMTYGLSDSADLCAKKVALSFEGTEFTAHTPAGKIEVRAPLVGRINVYNILAAIGAAIALGVRRRRLSRASRIWSRCRDVFSGSMKGSRFWWSSITRTPTTRCAI